MKARRYSEAQVFRILQEVDSGKLVITTAREHGVSPATIHRWKTKYGGMALSNRHSRYGYRRITVLLRREGWRINRKRVHRVWKSEGLGLSQRRPKRRRMGPVGELVNKAEYPSHVWSYDFVEDRTERGGKLRILVIIDEYTRECLAIRVALSIPASAVVEVLEWLFLTRGVPKHIRNDNGPEFVAKAVCQ